jgi:hypothetical protein
MSELAGLASHDAHLAAGLLGGRVADGCFSRLIEAVNLLIRGSSGSGAVATSTTTGTTIAAVRRHLGNSLIRETASTSSTLGGVEPVYRSPLSFRPLRRFSNIRGETREQWIA